MSIGAESEPFAIDERAHTVQEDSGSKNLCR